MVLQDQQLGHRIKIEGIGLIWMVSDKIRRYRIILKFHSKLTIEIYPVPLSFIQYPLTRSDTPIFIQ